MLKILGAILLLACPAWAIGQPAAPEKVRINHRIEIEERNGAGKWELVPNDVSKPETMEFSLHHYRKGNAEGTTEILKRSVKAATLFRSEVRLSTVGSDPDTYHVYAMLRSGPTLRRHGKTITAPIGNAHDFEPMVLQDDPIKANGKMIRARLILSPAE